MTVDKQKEYSKRYRDKYPDKVRESWRKHRRDNPNRDNEYHQNNIKSWEGYIPEKNKCQLCNRDVVFNKRDPNNSIHWDHKTGLEEIKGRPTAWLMSHKRTPENQAIWESCNFGILCRSCNRILPTKNRHNFYINIGKYILNV